MNAIPLPLADLLPAGPGTLPATGADLQPLADPPLAADPTATPRAAADFAAMLLASAGRIETGLGEPAGASKEAAPEAQPAPTSPAPAIDALLFMTALQAPSVGQVAVTSLAAVPVVDARPASAIDALPPLHVAAPGPAAAPTLEALGQTQADPSALPLIAPAEIGAWRAKLPALEIPNATPGHRESERHVLIANLGSQPVDGSAADDATRRVPDALPIDPKAAIAAAAGSQATSLAAPAAAVDPMPPLAPAPNFASPLPAPAVSVAIETPVHETTWRIDVANRIAGLVTRGVEHAELRVTPPELGPVELRIDLRGVEATLAIVATQATTRDALEQALPLLRDMLAQHGLALGEATVQDGREQGSASGDSSAARGRDMQDSDATPLVEARPAQVRRLIDVFA